jgi:hypothetical protein
MTSTSTLPRRNLFRLRARRMARSRRAFVVLAATVALACIGSATNASAMTGIRADAAYNSCRHEVTVWATGEAISVKPYIYDGWKWDTTPTWTYLTAKYEGTMFGQAWYGPTTQKWTDTPVYGAFPGSGSIHEVKVGVEYWPAGSSKPLFQYALVKYGAYC